MVSVKTFGRQIDFVGNSIAESSFFYTYKWDQNNYNKLKLYGLHRDQPAA